MAFDKYKNGAWQEPESGVKRYENGAWTDCESAKRYVDGAWTEVWTGDTNIYYVKAGVLQSGVSTSVGSNYAGTDTVSSSGGYLTFVINNTGSVTVSKIQFSQSLLSKYSGKSLVIEGSWPSTASIQFKYWYAATSSGSYQNLPISSFSSGTSKTITIPSTLYSGSDLPPYIQITGGGSTVKFSNIYIAN